MALIIAQALKNQEGSNNGESGTPDEAADTTPKVSGTDDTDGPSEQRSPNSENINNGKFKKGILTIYH